LNIFRNRKPKYRRQSHVVDVQHEQIFKWRGNLYSLKNTGQRSRTTIPPFVVRISRVVADVEHLATKVGTSKGCGK